MDQGLIPRRYAKALYEVGEERHDNDALYVLMEHLRTAFAGTPGLCATVANPFVDTADKTKLLTTAAYGTDGAAPDKTFEDFLALLAENDRMAMARDIAIAFIDLYRKKHGIYKVEICSAAPMGDAERKRLESIVANHIGKGSMEFDYSVDPSLIGGFTVTVNSERLDASVSNELKKLRLSLVK